MQGFFQDFNVNIAGKYMCKVRNEERQGKCTECCVGYVQG